jgi:hypothetical protein
MNNKDLVNGLVILAMGFLASSLSSFLEHFAIFGTANDFFRGLFDGLAAVTFCAAIFVLARSRRPRKE